MQRVRLEVFKKLKIALLLVIVLIMCHRVLACSEIGFDRFERFTSCISPFAWPIVILLLIVIFYKNIRESVSELPAFIRRSRYGNGKDVVKDISVKGSDILYCHNYDKAMCCINKMRKNDFSACPVLTRQGRFYGVLTIESWVDYLEDSRYSYEATVAEVLSIAKNKHLRLLNLPSTMFVESDESLCDAKSRILKLGNMRLPTLLIIMSERRTIEGVITPGDLLRI